MQRLLKLAEQRPERRALRLVRGEKIARALVGAIKAAEEPRVRHQPVEIFSVEIEDDALVRRAFVDQRLVDRVVGHQKDVPRPQRIDDALHRIVDAPGEQQHDLVELVKMKITLRAGAVAQVEIVVIFLQIALAGVFFLCQEAHLATPCWVCSTIIQHVLQGFKQILQFYLQFSSCMLVAAKSGMEALS